MAISSVWARSIWVTSPAGSVTWLISPRESDPYTVVSATTGLAESRNSPLEAVLAPTGAGVLAC